ncbi:MAG: ATP-binding protein, partial [Bacteroidota bacterium]|nr:ATP-binding protein [Bacteroidota bacterium]
MILKKARIQNFKSITDSEEFTIENVTCLVGKNESGKTAILQALAKLDPVAGAESDEAKFNELEFPRMYFADYDEASRPTEVLTTTWELSSEDMAAIEKVVGVGNITSNIITLKKGYKNRLEWTVSLKFEPIVKSLIAGAGLHTEEAKLLSGVTTTSALIDAVNSLTTKSERHNKLIADFKAAFPEGNATLQVNALLYRRLPQFLYFGNYDLMKGEVALDKIAADKKADKLSNSDRIFLALLEMAGTTVEEIQKITRFENLVSKLEAVSNRLSRQIFAYWSQNKHLAIDFRFDAARPDDQPPFDEGYIFRTRIKNNRHGVTVSFDDRSTGFVWFFSFLVWFSKIKTQYPNLIILLDEPGLNLHAKAQADLLRYIKDKLAPSHQVLYTTHSPFLIDPENLLSVRTVEDVTKNEETLGTKVSDNVLSTDRDTIFPLQTALGYDITQTLFVGKNVLLVEGPSDLIYISWASEQLRKRRRTALDKKWTVTPAGSVDKISSFVSLFGGNAIHIAALTDFAHGERGKVQRLKENQLLESGHVFTLDAFSGQPEADIEDMLGRELYIALVSQCYSLKAANKLAKTKPASAPIRVVKEVEDHFRALPATVEEFNHYT